MPTVRTAKMQLVQILHKLRITERHINIKFQKGPAEHIRSAEPLCEADIPLPGTIDHQADVIILLSRAGRKADKSIYS